MGDEIVELARVVAEEDDRGADAVLADGAREAQRRRVFDVQRGDDQIEALFAAQRERFPSARRALELRRERQLQAVILALDLLVQQPFFFEQVEVEEAGDEEDVADAMPLERLEALQPGAESFVGDYTTP